MKTIASICLVLTTLSSIVIAEKLQIIVEENIEDCEYRAQNGDSLYTYYTVSIEWMEWIDVFYMCEQ